MRFDHVSIVGLGLIGGSFALAARRAGLARRITGYDRAEAISKALDSGLIDDIETAFENEGHSDADFIYLAAPVGSIIEFLKTRGDSIKPGAIVTDAGSTKREICRAARAAISGRAFFVGGHPLAGSHRTGIDFASADLFTGAPYAIVLDEEAFTASGQYREAASRVIETVKRIGATPIEVSAEDHDRAVARTSHLPQLVSTSLALLFEGAGESLVELSGSGLASMTRLAQSNWLVWEDICKTNADEIDAALAAFIEKLDALRLSIATGRIDVAREYFLEANELMRRFHSRKAIILQDSD
jgi:prephenate dehydrogenase